MQTPRTNRFRLSLLLAGALTMGTAGLASAQPGAGDVKVRDHRAKKNNKSERVKARKARKAHKARRGKRGRRGHKRGAWIKRVDTNGDGVISTGERISFQRKRFVQLDANNNGVITRGELVNAKPRKARRGKRGKRANKGNKGNKNMSAKRAARRERRARRFEKMDRNHNGRVNWNEFQAARKGKKARKGNRKHWNGQKGKKARRGKNARQGKHTHDGWNGRKGKNTRRIGHASTYPRRQPMMVRAYRMRFAAAPAKTRKQAAFKTRLRASGSWSL